MINLLRSWLVVARLPKMSGNPVIARVAFDGKM
jgi:hypothetical protein